MADDKGYKDTKEFICVSCGKTIILTKFASQKTCKCDECKSKNLPINPDIVTQAMIKNPPKARAKSDGGNTKIRPCTNCGKDVEVSKFMSDLKVLCDECKGTAPSSNYPKMVADVSKFKSVKMPPIEDYQMDTAVIANPRLREVVCPACGHNYMTPLMIVDWSQFGMIIHYQCEECFTSIELSEQSRIKMRRHNPVQRFDYTGREIKELSINWKDHTRIGNALDILIHKCEENNINIDDWLHEFSDTCPPYKDLSERPVPKGFVLPDEDKIIKCIDDAIKYLEDAELDDSQPIVNKLKELLQ